jgi:hypothetical protein
MTSQGNGQPIRYNVQLAGLTRELLRKLHGQQAKIGRGQQFVSAFRQIVLRLQREPLEFGEPLYRLPRIAASRSPRRDKSPCGRLRRPRR